MITNKRPKNQGRLGNWQAKGSQRHLKQEGMARTTMPKTRQQKKKIQYHHPTQTNNQ